MALGDRLCKEGYSVEVASDGEDGFDKATSSPFDVILLDVMLPGRNGFDLCHDIRVEGLRTPILLVTARSDLTDKVMGLKLGADDYVTKPFDMQEVLARIEALLRRAPSRPGSVSFQFGSLLIESKVAMYRRLTTITRSGSPVYLSGREFELLRYFVEHRDMILSRQRLLRDVWGYRGEAFTRTVDVHVASLRQKLEKDPKQPELIITVHGIGYRFVSDSQS